MNLRKTTALLSTLVTLWSGASFADTPKRHPLYPQGDPKTFYSNHISGNIETVVGDCKNVTADQVKQSIYVNIPGFYLRLENKVGDTVCSTVTFPVRVGRHWKKHFGKVSKEMETPVGEGTIDDKKWSGTFRYFDDVFKTKCVRYGENKKHKKVCVEQRKVLVHHKGDIIRETSTFTDDAKPMTVPIEYNWMHSLGMKIFPEGKSDYTTRCVIHATTDSHTVGNAASHCCVGLRINDMLQLYGLVIPEQERGDAKREVSLKLEYKVVERVGDQLVLHADIYERKENYVGLIEEELGRAGYRQVDEGKIKQDVKTAQGQFNVAYPSLRKKLLQDRFITREEVGKMHYSIPIKELVK